MISSDHYRRKLVLLGFLLLVGCLAPVRSERFDNLNDSTIFGVNDSLTSPSKYFELGIFPYTSGHYLCIRYFPPIEPVVTFVANRDHPVSNSTTLQFVNGQLQLYDPENKDNEVPWKTSSEPSRVRAVKAILSDAGNLLLLDDEKGATYDSFKDAKPTDTLLPGQYMYRNQSHDLTSWQKDGNPAIEKGSYTFGWIENMLTLSWTPPEAYIKWPGGPYIPAPDVHNARKIENVDYVYFHEKLGHLYINSIPSDTSILSGGSDHVNTTTLKRITVGTDGGFRIFEWTIGQNSTSWTPKANWLLSERPDTRSQCTAYGTCGAYERCTSPVDSLLPVQCSCPDGLDSRLGCNPSSTPVITEENCTDSSSITASFSATTDTTDLTMLTLEGIDMPWGGDYLILTGNASANCKEACMHNCWCSGAVYSEDEKMCWAKTGKLYNIGYPTSDLHGTKRIAYIRRVVVPTYKFPSPAKKTPWGLIFGLAVPGGVVVVLVVASILYLYSSGRLRERVCCCELWRARSPAISGQYSGSESEEHGPPHRA